MNFLLRTTNPVVPDIPRVSRSELHKDMQPVSKRATTLEGLIAEDLYPNSATSKDNDDIDSDGVGDVSCVSQGPTSRDHVAVGKYSDVSEDEGWITIPYKELPDGWSDASDIRQLCYLDRSFVFLGEQLHVLVCLSASKQDAEIITPFKVAALISRNGSPTQSGEQQLDALGNKSNSASVRGDMNDINNGIAGHIREENGRIVTTAEEAVTGQDISVTESLLRMEDHKQQTETLLERFRNSNFFVRFAAADEPLWSRRNTGEQALVASEMTQKNLQLNDKSSRDASKANHVNAVIDRGSFDGRMCGGVARNTVRCYSLCNGDIVVLLQVNVGVGNIKDPVLEVLQFEKHQTNNSAFQHPDHFLATDVEDPCQELLSWLLPLDHAPPPPRTLSPPLGSTSGLSSAHQRSSSSASGSQIFSFSHFRSYSMPSLPQISGPSTTAVPPASSRPDFDLEYVDHFSLEKLMKSKDTGNEGLLSFRGVSLEPERFSVHCGLEGTYLPGRRWRRKVEIVQPIEIHSFAAECITEDLLCVQVKNVSPPHLPDIIIYLDAISIVFEEASEGGAPLSLPITSIESGNAHSLPNLALRRGEEHSFILKPMTTIGRDLKSHGGTNSLPTKMGTAALSMHLISSISEGMRVSTSTDQFAILVSCRCNHTESKLFFKQPTSWRPRLARDLMISVASELTEQTIGPNGRVPQLPVQVLNLQASNLTSEDLTLTVLAPVSYTCPPSVVSLNSAPTPISSFVGFPEIMGRVGGDKNGTNMQRLSSMPTVTVNKKKSNDSGIRSISLGQQTGTTADSILTTDLGCTHLWLQSMIPLGCVPARSSATVKLELLPLTDGIIMLDTLQVAVKEKGMTYKPEQPLEIHATSSIAAAIV